MNIVEFLTKKRKGSELATETLRRAIKEGVKFEVSAMGGGHNYGSPGTPLLLKSTISVKNQVGGWIDASSNVTNAVTNFAGNTLNFSYISVLHPLTEEAIKEKIKSLNSKKKSIDLEITVLKDKLSFIKENELDEFDENQFKAYSILQTLKKASSDIEKAKLIADIIK